MAKTTGRKRLRLRQSKMPIAIAIIGIMLLLSISPASGESAFVKGFSSSIFTDTGLQPNLDSLHNKVTSVSTYKVSESASDHLRWRLGTSSKSDTAIVFSDGKIQVGSSLKFDPTAKDQLDSELSTVIKLINSTAKISDASKRQALSSAQYYSGDSPVDAETWRKSGDQLFNKGAYDKSLVFYDKSLAQDQSRAETWNNKGAAFLSVGRSQDALNCYDKAINLTQGNSYPWNNKGVVLYNLGKIGQALECLNRSCLQDSGNAVAWYNKGVLLSYLNQYKDALDCYNRSIENNYYSPQAWNNKGLSLVKLGRQNSSLECFRDAIDLNQKYAEPWVNGGIVMHELGFELNSKDAFEQAKKLGYNGPNEFQWSGMAPPELMGGSSKALPGLGDSAPAIGVMAALLIIRWGRKIIM